MFLLGEEGRGVIFTTSGVHCMFRWLDRTTGPSQEAIGTLFEVVETTVDVEKVDVARNVLTEGGRVDREQVTMGSG